MIEEINYKDTGIIIHPERDNKLSDFSKNLLSGFYLNKGETIQEGFARASLAWCGGDKKLAQRIYDYVSKGFCMFASPVLSNAPEVETLEPLKFKKNKGLPISCFLLSVDDSIEGLIDHTSEERWLSVLGGGVGSSWRKIRSVSDKSPGPIPFLHTIDADMEAYRQGFTRRGSYAAYLDVSHPDIIEFLNIRVPTGDMSRKCHSSGFHNAINISDAFMEAVISDSKWDLIDPASKEIKETVDARDLWDQILDTRYRTGEPYLCFIDECNRHLPKAQRDKGLEVNGSNLCTEILLPTSSERTAVCCLSSLNLETYDEWKDTNIVQDLILMLDNVLQYFIDNAPDPLKKAVFSASQERSLGLGVMGFHYYLQKNMISFESEQARNKNKEMFGLIKSKANEMSLKLGNQYGECPDLQTTLVISGEDYTLEINSSEIININSEQKRAFNIKVGDKLSIGDNEVIVEKIEGLHSHSGRRNAHLLAPAPTSNSGIILGTSPSIEPANANAYTHQTRAGSWAVKNSHLEKLLESKGKNTTEIWSDIINSKGSVQHLDFLTSFEKEVFKTAIEINQNWVIQHASDRQPFICQSQSINLFLPPKCSRNFMSKLHITAWKKKVKTLYYVRTTTPHRAENINQKVESKKLQDGETGSSCVACEG